MKRNSKKKIMLAIKSICTAIRGKLRLAEGKMRKSSRKWKTALA